jgi:hypothetical protein
MGAERQRAETRHQEARRRAFGGGGDVDQKPKQGSRGDRKTHNFSGRASEAAQRGPTRRLREGALERPRDALLCRSADT